MTGLLEYDAAVDGFPRGVVWIVFWLPLISLAGLLAAAMVSRPVFDKALEEDSALEWAQFGLCLFAGVIALLSVRGAVRRRSWLLALALLVAGLGVLLLAGEEISWGQRVFGFATPEVLEGDRQGEAGLRNVGNGFEPEVFRQIQLLLGVLLAGLTLLGRLGGARPGSFRRIVAPPLFALPAFLAMPGLYLYRRFAPAEADLAGRLQEWAELCQYAGLAIALISVYFALRPYAEPIGGRARHAARYLDDRDWLKLVPPAGAVLVATLVFAILARSSGITTGAAP